MVASPPRLQKRTRQGRYSVAIQNDLFAHPSRLNAVIARAVDGSKSKLQWYHKNYLDHVYAVSDDDGDILEHYRYTAFGEVTIYNATGIQQTTTQINNTILWNTRRRDTVSGYYMYKFRHYSAELGRWPSRDPIEESGGVNLYAFVGNDPVGRWDRLGLVNWKNALNPKLELAGIQSTKDITGETDGEVWTVTTDKGNPISAFRTLGKNGKPDNKYWCHGYTFGGVGQGIKGTALSVLGSDVVKILNDEWIQIECAKAQKNDIVIFWKQEIGINHSAVFDDVVKNENGTLDTNATTLMGKHGIFGALKQTKLINDAKAYGEYECYAKIKKEGACIKCSKMEVCSK